MKKYKRLLLMAGLVGLIIVLSGCGTGEVSAQSTGIWDRLHCFIILQKRLKHCHLEMLGSGSFYSRSSFA